MFELGTTDHWWPVAKRYPALLSNKQIVLKPVGYANIVTQAELLGSQRILEIGHGAGSPLFSMLGETRELWGIDDEIKDNAVTYDRVKEFREQHPSAVFIEGVVGADVPEIPRDYFDLICSVSVIEHIPNDSLDDFVRECFEMLSPGGVVIHSFDVYWGQPTSAMFDAHENAGFEWMTDREAMFVPWESFLPQPDIEELIRRLGKVVFENPAVVAEYYMWKTPREERPAPGNWTTILIGAKRPE